MPGPSADGRPVRGAVRRSGQRGVTYVEMVATATILMILASAIMPVARIAKRRQQEIELRRELRVLRTAIDNFKAAADGNAIPGTQVETGSDNYPPDLETLVEGVNAIGRIDHKIKFLRRIPTDPMTRSKEWGLRCYQDEPDSTSWCRKNVYDVYTKYEGKALDGTEYKDW